MAAARLSDAFPLIRGAVLYEGLLNGMSFVEVASWLSAFCEPLPLVAVAAPNKLEQNGTTITEHSKHSKQALDITSEMVSEYVLNRNYWPLYLYDRSLCI
jgi:hypothetical protein